MSWQQDLINRANSNGGAVGLSAIQSAKAAGATTQQINALLSSSNIAIGDAARAAGYRGSSGGASSVPSTSSPGGLGGWQQQLASTAQSNSGVGLAAINRALQAGATSAQVNSFLASRNITIGDSARAQGYGGSGTPSNTLLTLPGQLQGGAMAGYQQLLAANPGNQVVQTAAASGMVDALQTQQNTAQSIQYNDAYLASLSRYQQGLENLRLGNTQQLMGQEGAITERLQGQQIRGQRDIADIQAGTARYGYNTDLEGIRTQARAQVDVANRETKAQRYGYELGLEGEKTRADAAKFAAGESAGATRYSADRGAEADKYGYEQQRYGVEAQAGATKFAATEQAGATRFSAQAGADADKYGADQQFKAADVNSGRQLEGTRYGYDSQERQIGLTGEQERKNIAEKYNRETESQVALRRDARGAIAKAGSRFYG